VLAVGGVGHPSLPPRPRPPPPPPVPHPPTLQHAEFTDRKASCVDAAGWAFSKKPPIQFQIKLRANSFSLEGLAPGIPFFTGRNHALRAVSTGDKAIRVGRLQWRTSNPLTLRSCEELGHFPSRPDTFQEHKGCLMKDSLNSMSIRPGRDTRQRWLQNDADYTPSTVTLSLLRRLQFT